MVMLSSMQEKGLITAKYNHQENDMKNIENNLFSFTFQKMINGYKEDYLRVKTNKKA